VLRIPRLAIPNRNRTREAPICAHPWVFQVTATSEIILRSSHGSTPECSFLPRCLASFRNNRPVFRSRQSPRSDRLVRLRPLHPVRKFPGCGANMESIRVHSGIIAAARPVTHQDCGGACLKRTQFRSRTKIFNWGGPVHVLLGLDRLIFGVCTSALNPKGKRKAIWTLSALWTSFGPGRTMGN